MKKKHLNTIKIASLTLMLGCFAVGGVYNHYQDKQQNHVVNIQRNLQPKYVSYNDESYTITLTVEELTNYSWDNFYSKYNELRTSSVSVISGITYNNNVLSNIVRQTKYFAGNYEQSAGVFISICFNCKDVGGNYSVLNDNLFHIYNMGTETTFAYDLQLTIYSNVYSQIKSAIELDIQANQPVSMGDSIVGAITSGLGLIPDLANEFLTGFSTLFWNNTTETLTTFGLFSLVFLGIAITMAVIKLVLAIIRGSTGA